MAEEDGFLRKVARFVAHPATDWAELNSRQSVRPELDKSELKAMVERKRRNDFVRKREFDLLRRMRRDGLTPEQLAAIGTSSRVDDTGLALADVSARPEGGVTAKINHIEREMVGDAPDALPARRTRSGAASRWDEVSGASVSPAGGGRSWLPADAADRWRATDPLPLDPGRRGESARDPAEVLGSPGSGPAPGPAHRAGAQASTFAPDDPLPSVSSSYDAANAEAAETGPNGPAHDPALDETVIAFANADFDLCEQSLRDMVAPGGLREAWPETWLVLFDLFRATGQHERFEALAFEYARRLSRSAPTWYSLPKAVADALCEDQPTAQAPLAGGTGQLGWACPPLLDAGAISSLRSQAMQLPQPWVLDWSSARSLDVEAATQLNDLLRSWAGQPLEMRWIGADHLVALLAEAASTGDRDADPAFWMARLAVLRLLNRADLFDETAIDYCMTYEVSPPAWEPPRCRARQSTSGASLQTQPMSIISEVSTSFMESTLFDDEPAQVQVASLELSGQLVGDIGQTLDRLDGDIGAASIVNVSCARLIRVDFLAAGDLLNWVLAKRSENRAVQFIDTHRLVALFFVAMGINEHAGVHVRRE
ncbi:MAG: hypothetical protein RI988_3607 [Pseudomonadota bacterium]